MRTKPFFQISILLLLIFSTDSLCQDKMTCGIKGGIGICRFISHSAGSGSSSNYPAYSYPIGFSIGLFLENKITNNFSITNEVFYQNSSGKTVIYTGIEGILEQKIINQFLNLPVLIKYQTSWLYNTYFFAGPSFAYLIKAKYNYYDQVYHDKGDLDLTNNFPALSTAIEFGFGEKLKSLNSNIYFELRGQLGLTEFKYEQTGISRNIGLLFFIGYQVF